MKKCILCVGKILPKWINNINKSFEIITKKDALKGYKEIYNSTPDAIIYSLSDSFYDGYYLSKLLSKTEETEKIPFIITNNNIKIPENIDFNAVAQIASDIDEESVTEIINNILDEYKLSKSDKTALKNNIPNNKLIKIYTEDILDELLINSSIVDEFKSLIDSMNYDNVLAENIIKIINRYLNYDIAGIYINDSDESARNILNLSIPNKNITLELANNVRDKFFDEIEKFKRVNEIQCNLIYGDVVEKTKIKPNKFKFQKIVTYTSGEKLTGGIFLYSEKPLNVYENIFLEIIVKELDAIFKIKYLFKEQEKNAFKDPMTGLYNRQLFDSNIENEFHRARRYIFNFTLAMLDIDYLSKINEKYGKDFGDFVLVELSSILKQVFRRTDLVYRYGGEEIMVYLPSTPITKALIPIERLRAHIANHVFEKNGIKANITISVGLCANYSKFTEPNQLLDGVANAMLRAKERGRNKVDIYE